MEAGKEATTVNLIPPIRQRQTNFKKCIVCQLDTNDVLRKAKTTSKETFIDALNQRQDHVYDRVKDEEPNLKSIDVYWHHSCHSSYTSSRNLRYVKKRKLSVSPAPSEEPMSSVSNENSQHLTGTSRVLRSQYEPTDWSKCIFCKHLTHKKVKDLINVSTFQGTKRIREAAVEQGDNQILALLDSVNDDLIAAKAKYHKTCHSSYISKSNLKHTSQNEGIKEDVYQDAFLDMIQEITPDLRSNKAFDMSTLLGKYKYFLKAKGVLPETAKNYTAQKLKLRLRRYYNDEIVFHQPHDRTMPELVYSSSLSLQAVINSAYHNRPLKPASLLCAEETSVPSKNLNYQAESNGSRKETNRPCTSSRVEDPSDHILGSQDRLLYHAAKIIKSDISTCKGILAKPPNPSDISLAACKSAIPESLYNLLRWIITKPEKDDEHADSNCRNMADEKRILMLGQDIVYCASHSQAKMPKHVGLAMTLRHLTGSKQIIQMLNRMGHCCSYDDIEVMDTCLAHEIITKSEVFGVLVPNNIVPGQFVQAAADNNDINEETLDGKSTTHATTLVLYQQGQFGPLPQATTYADHSKRKKSLDKTDIQHTILEYNTYGKRPAAKSFVGKITDNWFNCTCENHSIQSLDLAWAICRLCPAKLFEVSLPDIPPTEQKVPTWSAFNAMVHQQTPVRTNIGYCPMINGSPTDFSTVYTVMKSLQKMMKSLGQKESVITFDLAIYIKAKEIQWRNPDEFDDMVVRMGGFHIILNFLALLGKKFENSGLEDLLIESGVYGSATISSAMKGKAYNRGIRAHKLTMEALFRLQWQAFTTWYQERDDTKKTINQDILVEVLTSLQNSMQDKEKFLATFQQFKHEIRTVEEEFSKYNQKKEGSSKLCQFWNNYVGMVQLLLQFIRAERTGNWHLHLSTTAAMIPHFFSMDRPNYSRWLPVYIADMQQLDKTHPRVYEEFMRGNHTISRSGQPFTQVSTDMALEQSINLDSKTKGGIIGITKKPEALERWFLTSHQRAAITTAVKEMLDMGDNEVIHKEASPSRISRDEGDVQKILHKFSTGLITDPFIYDDSDSLLNLATGMVMPLSDASNLLNACDKGARQMSEFIEQRLNSNNVSFWDHIPNLKIKTFATMAKTCKVKSSSEKAITVNADRDLLNRLVIAAKSRSVNLKNVLSYELSTVPFSMTHIDGTLRKTNKSVLLGELQINGDMHPKLPPTQSGVSTALVIDGMAVVQMIKSGGATTFGELASIHFKFITSSMGMNGCCRVDIVFDQYLPMSIKAGERLQRGQSSALEVKILSQETPIPKQWHKYIANPENKRNLCDFLVKSIATMGHSMLHEGQQLYIGGGHKNDTERAILISRGQQIVVEALNSNHEEADTRLLLHAKHASMNHQRIIIQSPDTDVAVLCTAHFELLNCQELWFRTGVRDKVRYIAIHKIFPRLGKNVCKSLPGFHAVTGCDSTSSFAGIGKKKAFKILLENNAYQEALGELGDKVEISNNTLVTCEQFVCNLYTNVKKAGCKVDDIRYWLFCQKQKRNEGLPPTSDSLYQHLKRANFQAYVWKKSFESIQHLPKPENHGWKIENDVLQPVLMTKDPAPTGLLQLTHCGCKNCSRAYCACKVSDLGCTEACKCMGNEECLNPLSTLLDDNED